MTTSSQARTELSPSVIPLWLASAITVALAIPFAIWLGDYSLPIWASFIVWAEYFALGAKPSGLRIIVPAYTLGVLAASTIATSWLVLADALGETERLVLGGLAMSVRDATLFVAFFVGFSVFTYAMRFFPVTLGVGSLPFFNGISMMLAVFFTGAFARAAPADLHPYLAPSVAGIGALLAGYLGAFLGWFNVAIMDPPRPRRSSVGAERRSDRP